MSAIYRIVECTTLAFISLCHPMNSSHIYLISKNCFDFCVSDVTCLSLFTKLIELSKKKIEIKIDAFHIKAQDSLRKCHNSTILVPILLTLMAWLFHMWTLIFLPSLSKLISRALMLIVHISLLFFFTGCTFLRQDKRQKKR